MEIVVKENGLSEKKAIRKSIMDFEELLKKQDNVFLGDTPAVCPLIHKFADEIYVREIHIPKGIVLTGKIHLHKHPNFLMKGKVIVFTESGGEETLEAPQSIISEAGTKRVVLTLEDTIWVTVHSNPKNIQDTDEIEKFVIAPTYQEYEKFRKSKKGFKQKLKTFIIQLLN